VLEQGGTRRYKVVQDSACNASNPTLSANRFLFR
jgi:hypothetical protein